jgi:hypothetical protein
MRRRGGFVRGVRVSEVGNGAVNAQDGGAIVCEEEASEGALKMLDIRASFVHSHIRQEERWSSLPGARPASSMTRIPVNGGGAAMMTMGAACLFTH